MMKTNKTMNQLKAGLVIALVLFFVASVPAQQEMQIAQAMQQNARELRQYSWKSRTEIRKDTELKKYQLHLMHYAVDGTLQQSLIDESAAKIPTHGIRGLIAKKKKEDFMKTLNGLGAVAKSYSELSPQQMKQFIGNAIIKIDNNSQPVRMRIYGRDVLQPGDSVTIWVDMAAGRQRRMEINTTFENEIVRIVCDFQDLPGGPTYMSRSVIDYQNEGISVTKENFDHHRNQPATGSAWGATSRGTWQ